MFRKRIEETKNESKNTMFFNLAIFSLSMVMLIGSLINQVQEIIGGLLGFILATILVIVYLYQAYLYYISYKEYEEPDITIRLDKSKMSEQEIAEEYSRIMTSLISKEGVKIKGSIK